MTPLVSRSRRWTTRIGVRPGSVPGFARSRGRRWLPSVSLLPGSSATLSMPAGLSTTTTSPSENTIASRASAPGRSFGPCSSTATTAPGETRAAGSVQRSPSTVTRPSTQSFFARDHAKPVCSRTTAATVGLPGESLPAIDADHLRGHPARQRRGEEERDARHLLRPAEALPGHRRERLVVERRLFGLALLPRASGKLDRARRDAVDANSPGGKRRCLSAGVVDDCALGGTVRGGAHRGVEPRPGRDVDDGRIAPFEEERQGRPRGAHHGHQVDREAFLPGGFLVADRPRRGVVHQHVDAAQRGRGIRDVARDVGFAGKVAGLGMGERSRGHELVAGRLEGRGAARAYRHLRAALREGERDRAPDAAAAAGDHYALVLYVDVHRFNRAFTKETMRPFSSGASPERSTVTSLLFRSRKIA